MPMELYSADAFARDLVNAISESEGKPLNIGSGFHEGIDREYAFRLIKEAKCAINDGQAAPSPEGTYMAPDPVAAPGHGDE